MNNYQLCKKEIDNVLSNNNSYSYTINNRKSNCYNIDYNIIINDYKNQGYKYKIYYDQIYFDSLAQTDRFIGFEINKI